VAASPESAESASAVADGAANAIVVAVSTGGAEAGGRSDVEEGAGRGASAQLHTPAIAAKNKAHLSRRAAATATALLY
jgi:hypothetical protein